MNRYLDSALNIALDRSPQEWIVGIVIALFLALAMAGLNMAFRRWVKAKDDTVPLVGVGVVAVFAGMVISGLYFELNRRVSAGPPLAGGGPAGPGGPGGGGRGFGGGRFSTRMAGQIFDSADADKDGLLSIDEAANAAAKFIHDSDSSGKGKLDREALAGLLRQQMAPPGSSTPAATAPAAVATGPAPSPAPAATAEGTPPASPPPSPSPAAAAEGTAPATSPPS